MKTQAILENRSNSVPNEIHKRKSLYSYNNDNIQRTIVTNTEEESMYGSLDTRTSSSSSKSQNKMIAMNQFPIPPLTEYRSQLNITMSLPTKALDEENSRQSSSESLATIGHGVTHASRMSNVNNNDHTKLVENIASESPAAFPVIDEKKMDLLQAQIQKMALNEDLVLLQRTVDRMQHQHATDMETYLTKAKEQKEREEEILEQIHLTKQQLEMAIAGKMFAEGQQQQGPFSSAVAAAAVADNDHDHKPKPSTSTNTARKTKLKASKDDTYQSLQEEKHYQRQKNRRSFPSSYQYDNDNNVPYPSYDRDNFEVMGSQHYPYHCHYGYPYHENGMGIGSIDSPPRMRLDSSRRYPPPMQQQQEHRNVKYQSKSIRSQWQNADHGNPHEQQQQQMHDNEPDLGYHQFVPTNRSRKSSLHSLRSDDVSLSNHEKVVGIDLKDEPIVKEDPAVAISSEEEIKKKRQHRRSNSGGPFRPVNTTNSRSSSTKRPDAPPMMQHHGTFVGGPPPPPYFFDRERMKARLPPPPSLPPPSFAYNNALPPPGMEHFGRMPPPPQKMSPRFMTAFAADEQQQQQQHYQQPPWHMGMGQWGPLPSQNMYNIPPPPNKVSNESDDLRSNSLANRQPPCQDQLPFNGRSDGGNRRFSHAATGTLGQQPTHHPQQTAHPMSYFPIVYLN